MTDFTWRGPFTSAEVNALHAEAFGGRVFADDEWDWETLVARHSLGWAVAREGELLIGFVNVVWDGFTHAWLQDVMVAASARHRGVGARLVSVAGDAARTAGCEWLHVDFEPDLRDFYIGACGFQPTQAGLLQL
jgi:GNAT superfamily N-acetyltransferase